MPCLLQRRTRLEPEVLPRGDREPFDEVVRNGVVRGKCDPGLGGLQPGGGDVFGMGDDGAWGEIEAALLTEGGVARDDRSSDLEPWHVVFDDLLRVRQGARELCAQRGQQWAELFWSRSDVCVVVGDRHPSILPR